MSHLEKKSMLQENKNKRETDRERREKERNTERKTLGERERGRIFNKRDTRSA